MVSSVTWCDGCFVLRCEVPDWMDFLYALVALNAGIITVFL